MASPETTPPGGSSADLTFETFPNEWLHKSGMDRERLAALWADAEAQYIDLPGHNFNHAREVLWESMRLADTSEGHGAAVNRRALIAASLLHDAGFHEDAAKHGYISKEARSAAIFVALAPQFGLTWDDTVTGDRAIAATQRGVKPVSTEDRILVRADLGNVFGDYVTSFFPTTLKFVEEASLLAGSERDAANPLKYLSNSIIVLADYFTNDLSLGDYEAVSWHQRPLQNLCRMAEEAAKLKRVPAVDFIASLGSTAASKLLSDRLRRSISDSRTD